jgi:hypothetical protein
MNGVRGNTISRESDDEDFPGEASEPHGLLPRGVGVLAKGTPLAHTVGPANGSSVDSIGGEASEFNRRPGMDGVPANGDFPGGGEASGSTSPSNCSGDDTSELDGPFKNGPSAGTISIRRLYSFMRCRDGMHGNENWFRSMASITNIMPMVPTAVSTLVAKTNGFDHVCDIAFISMAAAKSWLYSRIEHALEIVDPTKVIQWTFRMRLCAALVTPPELRRVCWIGRRNI